LRSPQDRRSTGVAEICYLFGLDELDDYLRELVEDLAEACGSALLLFSIGGRVVARVGQFGLAVAVVLEEDFIDVAFALLVGKPVVGGANAIAIGVGEIPEPDYFLSGMISPNSPPL
jgi:hypothetical protein